MASKTPTAKAEKGQVKALNALSGTQGGVRAILLAGGYGTRLAPLSLRTPKVLLPIAGKPGITHLLRLLTSAGITDVIISLNTRQKRVEEFIGNSFGKVNIRYCYEESSHDSNKRGALGAILHVLHTFGVPDECLVVGSDNYIEGLDVNAMRAFHHQTGATATLALYQLANRADVEHYGVTVLDAKKRVVDFQEKPKAEHARSQLASAAMYLLSKPFLTGALPDYVREHEQNGKKADRIGDLWQHYLGDARLPLYGFTFSGVWGDTNNVQTYIDTNKLAMNSLSSRGRVVLGKNVTVDKDATLIGPVVIDDHAVIGRAVIGPYTHVMHHARIDDGAIVTGSILFERAHVKKNARVEDAVVDGLAVIEENARLDAYTLVGYKAHVGKGARVLNRSKIWPGVTLSEGAVVEGDVETDVTVALQKELDESRFWK